MSVVGFCLIRKVAYSKPAKNELGIIFGCFQKIRQNMNRFLGKEEVILSEVLGEVYGLCAKDGKFCFC